MESKNKSMYASSENWYIGSTLARSYRTKYRIAARTEHGRYSDDASSICTDVVSAILSDSVTSSEVVFEAFRVLMSSMLSSSDPVAFESKSSKVSSSSMIVRFPFATLTTSSFFCLSRSGRSFCTTTFRSCASKPCSFTAKFTMVTFVLTSGV